MGKLHPLFEHLPVENMVFSNQQAYYDAITASTQAGDSGPFIDFMLGEILDTLKAHQGEDLKEVPNKVPNKLRIQHPEIAEGAWDVLAYLKKDTKASANLLGEKLRISDRMLEWILESKKIKYEHRNL